MPYNIFSKNSAFNNINLPLIYKKYNGPVWVYDASIILKNIRKLRYFDIIRFSQKSCSNIHILRLMYNQNIKIDSVSLGEIERALIAGFKPGFDSNEIILTTDLIDDLTLKRVIELKIPVNVGSIDVLIQLGNLSPGHTIWIRINPGFGHGHSNKTNTGGENSKHGIWYKDLSIALNYIHYYNFRLVGIHIHIGSGVQYNYLLKVCNIMIEQVIACKQNIFSISAGGGLSVPYKENDEIINVKKYFDSWNLARIQISKYLGYLVKLEIEPGRFLVASAGLLISQVKVVKNMGKNHFVLVDVGFNDLIRPAMYGSYHHITLLPLDNRNINNQPLINTIIGGPLCESGDIFTQDNKGNITPYLLPKVKVGDYLIFHDTGAYGSSMSSNYNSRPLLPEVIYENGIIKQIRRRQKLEELFSLEEQLILEF